MVGRVLGSAALPPESWALEDTSGDPLKTLLILKRGGVDTLGFRRYALAADSDHVVEVTLFVFARAADAAQWQHAFMSDATVSRRRCLLPSAVWQDDCGLRGGRARVGRTMVRGAARRAMIQDRPEGDRA